MTDMVVVYESDEWFWVGKVMDELRKEGFHPELADDASTAYYRMENKNPGILGMPQGRMKVSVVVPRQEEARARLFLLKRDEQFSNNVEGITGKLQRSLVVSALATAFMVFAYSDVFKKCLRGLRCDRAWLDECDGIRNAS